MAIPAVLLPLRRPRLRRMVSAQFMAELGDGISLVALPLYVWARTESEVWTSLTFGVELGLGVVFAMLGGILADVFDRQRVLLISYVIRASLLLLAYLVDPLLLAVAFGVSARALGMADNPSFDALIPDQAEDDLQQVVAIRRLVQAVSITIGPGIGALAVAVIGPRPALAANAVCFVFSFLILRSVPRLDADHRNRREALDGLPVKQALGDLLSGMGIVARTPGVRRLVLHIGLVMATVGLLMASALVFFERDLGVSDYWFGITISAYGIGSAIGLGFAGSYTFRMPLPRIILVATPLYAVACAIGAAVEWPELLALSWFLWGILLGPEFVASETFFVSRIEEQHRGRAFAGMGVAQALGMAIGSVAAAPLLSLGEARWVILWTGVAVLAIGLLWIRPSLQGESWPDGDVSIAEPYASAE